ncbi:MAG TPA: hypothetical protein VL424_09230 [Pararobbsia sp.]|nr:hypothetical protein [Pararobbsia sp.]
MRGACLRIACGLRAMGGTLPIAVVLWVGTLDASAGVKLEAASDGQASTASKAGDATRSSVSHVTSASAAAKSKANTKANTAKTPAASKSPDSPGEPSTRKTITRAADSHAKRSLQTILEYGDQCAREIGEICPFDCNSGTDIPITVHDTTPTDYRTLTQCDRPSLLDPGSQYTGQCAPYSKVLNLSRGSTQISVYCRRNTVHREANGAYYDEVDIVLHHTGTGKTCWFQSRPAKDGAKDGDRDKVGIDASRVPPPNERVAPDKKPSAVEFWRPPGEVAAAQCATCHDASPYIQSPFIAQVWDKVPTDPWGKYINIGADFASWRHAYAISTRGNTCIGCHRIGDERSCSIYVPMSAGLIGSPANLTPPKGAHFSPWMPTQGMTQDRWTADNIRSVNAILTCCADRAHKNPDCAFVSVMASADKPLLSGPLPADHLCPATGRAAAGSAAAR